MRKGWMVALLMGVSLFPAGIIYALDNSEDVMFAEIPSVVVTASRYETKIAESPTAISVITRNDIAFSACHTLPELLQYVVGVDGYTKTHTDMDIGIRGFATDDNVTIVVMIDGQNISIVPIEGYMWPTLPISMEDIERIEVLRGPASSVYGADALTGAINIITRKACDRQSHVSLAYGEKGYALTEAGVSGQLNENWTLAVNAGRMQTQEPGQAENADAKLAAPNGELKDWADVYRAGWRLDYDDNDYTFSSIGGYSSDQEGYNPSPGDHRVDRSAKDTVYVNNTYHTHYGSNELGAMLAVRDYRQRNDQWDGGPYAFKYLVRKALGIDIDLHYTWRDLPRQTLTAGLVSSYLNGSREMPDYMYDHDYSLMGAYLQDQFRFLDNNLLVSFDGRYDKWRTLDDVFTPKGAVNYFMFDKRVVVRASGQTAFRQPSLDGNYYFVSWQGGWYKGSDITATAEDGTVYPGKLMEPEKVTSYDLGMRLQPNADFFMDITGFKMQSKNINGNIIVYENASTGDINITLANTPGTVFVDGIEVELKKRFLDRNLNFFATYAWLRKYREENGAQTPLGFPEHKYSAGFLYFAPLGITADVRGRYISRRYIEDLPGITLDPYTSVDVAFTRKFGDHCQVKLACLNVFDEQHYEYPIYTTIVRRVWAAIQYTF